jgi:hypothetical protein
MWWCETSHVICAPPNESFIPLPHPDGKWPNQPTRPIQGGGLGKSVAIQATRGLVVAPLLQPSNIATSRVDRLAHRIYLFIYNSFSIDFETLWSGWHVKVCQETS